MKTSRVLCTSVCAIATSLAFSSDEQTTEPSETTDTTEDGAWADGLGERQEAWIFISIPRYGIVSLQELHDQSTAAYTAWLDVGEPLESYQPVALHTNMANNNNGGIELLMLPERCLGDFNADGLVDLYDIPAFLDAYLRQDPSADLTRDGAFDIRDQILFLELSTMPCVNGW